jgi:cellulose synthase (UDP-forming)
MDAEDRRAVIRSRVFALATLVSGLCYIVWLFFRVNPHHPWMAAAFVSAEIICLLLFLTASFTVWRLRYKPAEGLPISHPGSVDVFVTVCGEPIEVVTSTLTAASAIDWPGTRTLYVLDDGGSGEVEAAAVQRGFLYRSRRRDGGPTTGAKAGNLNFGLAQSDGELILVLDADQIAQPNILRALAGYMRFPDLAFIQSRQLYRVPVGDPFFNLDQVFYQAVQLGYDNRDSAISCGSGVLYRRAALMDNGGFASWNLVEDLTTSYQLHSRGWRSFYYPHAVSLGLAPSEIWGVYRQRGQWALDTMRLFFWDNPLFKRGLRWQRRMAYLVIPLTYLSAAFVFPFMFAIPVWTYLSGGSVLAGSELEFGVLRGIYLVMMATALRSLFRRQQAGRQFQMLVGLFPIYILGTLRALVYAPARRPAYVPNHAVRASARKPAVLAVLPQLTLLGANAVLPFYAIFAGTAEPRLILSNAFISAAAIWSLLPAISAALGKKMWDETAAA